ncbi:hypothetical protein P4H83_05680 [Paenibacillus favisporus]|uniref:hypothetical protein n=1 Tax=Paenibacillus TaxID=44249 RepID=UPI0011AB5E41|nr:MULTISPECIES: hypothetical protein [Paenibacillus]MEC0174355.1 hypothetical protein [Paenibacillus favisporus]
MDSLLTQDDLDEMETIAEVFLQQYNKFMMDTSSESNLQTILRAHLYIEFELEKLLLKTLTHPDILRGKLRFIDKVRFVFALGLLPKEEMDAIVKINNLRNAFAHKLEYDFSEDHLDKLIDSFSAKQHTEYVSYLGGESVTDIGGRLKMALFTIWISLYEVNSISKELAEKMQNNSESIKRKNK